MGVLGGGWWYLGTNHQGGDVKVMRRSSVQFPSSSGTLRGDLFFIIFCVFKGRMGRRVGLDVGREINVHCGAARHFDRSVNVGVGVGVGD